MLPSGMSVKAVCKSFPADKEKRMDPFLKKIISRNISDLSNGERRYLEVTLLFFLDRDYFLLDEPFTGIEPLIIELLIKKISKKAEAGSGILITDHYYHYLLEVADQGYLMQRKQCYDLENDLKSKLKSAGYIK